MPFIRIRTLLVESRYAASGRSLTPFLLARPPASHRDQRKHLPKPLQQHPQPKSSSLPICPHPVLSSRRLPYCSKSPAAKMQKPETS